MTVMFKIELRKNDCAPRYIGNVRAIPAPLCGAWIGGKRWKIDEADVLHMLPFHYRAAFNRGNQFWFTDDGKATCRLTGSRGQVLGAIWATPYEI